MSDPLTNQRGYTLIELMVSMAIFALVMVFATAAYLSFIAYNRQAQATASAMNSISYSLDSMSREIRSGTNYTVTSNVISFLNADGCTVAYQLDTNANAITRSASGSTCPANEVVSSATPITDAPTVIVTSLRILPHQLGVTGYQPIVNIAVSGYATIPNTGNNPAKVYFQIETSATQRLPVLAPS